jgi:threonine dehydratase
MSVAVTVTPADVERARETIAGRVFRTPTFTSAALGGVHLKAELFQHTGSFKARGALNRIEALTPDERARGVVTWSAGNHAQAVAWAAAQAGVDCLVEMWADASPLKVEAARGYGATVDTSSPDPAVAYERAQEVVEREGRVFVHPHSDPLVVAGHGTVALELLEDVPELDTVVVGVGGGGLVSGIVVALDGRARVVAVEPERSPALSAGLAAGRSVSVGTDTIAHGLAPPFAGELPLELCRDRVESVLVTEDEIAEGMRFLYAAAKLACEPSGAAAAAAVLAGKVAAGPGVAVVVSGGNVDPREAAAILAAR